MFESDNLTVSTSSGRVALLSAFVIVLVGGIATAQESNNTSDNVMASCGNFSLASDGSTLNGDCNSWNEKLVNPDDPASVERVFVEKKTGVSIDLDVQIRVESSTDDDGNDVVYFDQSNAPNGNFSDDCTGEGLTVNDSHTRMTLSASCTVDEITNDASIEISQFLKNGNGQISWKSATRYQ